MNQKGFTIIELLVSIGITAILVPLISFMIIQIVRGGPVITQRSVAIADIDSASHWLNRDLVLAQTTNLVDGAPPISFMSLDWSDLTAWAGDTGEIEHSVSYTLAGTELRRDYDGEGSIVGKYLSNVSFSLEDGVFNVTLTSQPGQADTAVTRSFSVEIRSSTGP